jgi:hypothetical protein
MEICKGPRDVNSLSAQTPRDGQEETKNPELEKGSKAQNFKPAHLGL